MPTRLADGLRLAKAGAFPNAIARLTLSPESGTAPITITADAIGSTVGASYTFDWGDGTPPSSGSRVISHLYSSGGTYTVVLTVDDGLTTATASTTLVIGAAVGGAPVAALTVGASTTGYVTHGIYAHGFTSTGTNPIASYTFNWGDGTPNSVSTKSIGGVAVPVPIALHWYTAPGTYTLTLTVRDSIGLSDTDTKTIVINPLPAPSVIINPGDPVLTTLNNAPANAVVKINAGTYGTSGQATWAPKADQIVYANGAVVIDGAGGPPRFAIPNTNSVNNCLVQGLEIKNFSTVISGQSGLAFYIDGGVNHPTTGWVLKNINIHDNGTPSTTGDDGGGGNLHAGYTTNAVFDSCHIHHADVIGATASNAVNLTVIGCEFDNNLTDTVFANIHSPYSSGGGGGKFLSCSGAFIGNNCHDNWGHGFWWDSGNYNWLIALNTVTMNDGGGLMWELNDAQHAGPNQDKIGGLHGTIYSARFLFNTLVDNGGGFNDGAIGPNVNRVMFGDAIILAASNYVDIQWNWMDGGTAAGIKGHGVTLNYSARNQLGINAPVDHVRIQNNDIRLGTGADQNSGVKRVGFYSSGKVGTLVANITAGQTSFAVAETAAPPAVAFHIYVGTEQMNVTARALISGSQYTYTVQRGINGTTVAAHSAGDFVNTTEQGGVPTLPTNIIIDNNHYWFDNPTTDNHFSKIVTTTTYQLITWTAWKALQFDTHSTQAAQGAYPH